MHLFGFKSSRHLSNNVDVEQLQQQVDALSRERDDFHCRWLSGAAKREVRVVYAQTDYQTQRQPESWTRYLRIPLQILGVKRTRAEFEAEETCHHEEEHQEDQEIRRSIVRVQTKIAAERQRPGFTYPFPAMQLPSNARALSRGVNASTQTGREQPSDELRALRRAWWDLRLRRTGVDFAALVRDKAEQPQEPPAALVDDLMQRVFELLIEEAKRAGDMPRAFRDLSACMRVSRRWLRLASDPRLWSTYQFRVHALQLPWACHTMATLPRFRSLSDLRLEICVGGFPYESPVWNEEQRCLRSLLRRPDRLLPVELSGEQEGAPRPLARVRSLALRVYNVRRQSVEGGLPWLPSCEPERFRDVLQPGLVRSDQRLFRDVCGAMRIAERFPRLRRLQIPGESLGTPLGGLGCLGDSESRVERLDVRVRFTHESAAGNVLDTAFPSLRRIGTLVAERSAGLGNLSKALTTPGARAFSAGTLEVVAVDFCAANEDVRPVECLRACLARLQPRRLNLNGCASLSALGDTLAPVEGVRLGPTTLSRLQPADLAWLARPPQGTSPSYVSLEFNPRYRYSREAVASLAEAVLSRPGLRRLAIRGVRLAELGGAARMREIRCALSLRPAEFVEKGPRHDHRHFPDRWFRTSFLLDRESLPAAPPPPPAAPFADESGSESGEEADDAHAGTHTLWDHPMAAGLEQMLAEEQEEEEEDEEEQEAAEEQAEEEQQEQEQQEEPEDVWALAAAQMLGTEEAEAADEPDEVDAEGWDDVGNAYADAPTEEDVHETDVGALEEEAPIPFPTFAAAGSSSSSLARRQRRGY